MEDISIYQIIFLFFFSGFISIDRLAGLNIMLSRPIIVSGIIGIVFNDIYIALMIGLIFEFIGMLEVPVGTTITHDDTFGGYASSLAMVLGIINLDAINILAAILITSLLMYPVTYSDKVFRNINRYLVNKSIMKDIRNNENKLIALGIILAFLRGVIVYNIGLFIIYLFMKYFSLIKLDISNLYDPLLALTLIATFMGGYLLRFLIINRLHKVILLCLGLLAGWFIQ